MIKQRPLPDELLQRAKEEDAQSMRGKLKIYLGAAPGVGKTYKMLQDAIEKRASDLDVIVGIVESHGRKEVESMLGALETIPRQSVNYHGKQLLEFDLDTALKRNPGLILMDEMAHTNAPGLRHEKRWQDIKELLDRGINVWTTLNVQHIESLNDDVAQIIQAAIKETVPDSMIDMANTIELVDLPPEELLKRLQDGKIYIPEQAALAREHFFRKGNLIALRELALRTAAELVGTDVLLYRQGEGIKQIWPTRDKILVCVGSRPESQKLIRAAKRLATSLAAEWLAVYVDTPKLQSSMHQRNSAIKNLRFAEQLGAETHVLAGYDIVKEVMSFAHEHNVTQIMIWKHIFTRWRNWFRRNLADEIIRNSGDIDVYMMIGESITPVSSKTPVNSGTPWKAYGISLGVVVLTTLLNMVLYPLLPMSNLVMVYLLGVTIVALLGRAGPSILASLLSVLAYGFFFAPPVFSLSLSDVHYFFTLIVMLFVSQIIAHLTVITQRQADAARFTQHQTSALYTLSRQLTTTRGVDNLLALGTRFIANAFNSDVMALLPRAGHLEIQASQPEQLLDEKEMSIAQWVYEMNQTAGFGTDTLSFSSALYLPLSTQQGPLGVLRIEPRDKQLFTPEQRELLESCMNQIALALNVDNLQEKTRKKALKQEAEHVRNVLLQDISHALHNPLKKVIRTVNHLKTVDEKTISELTKDIDFEIGNLIRLNNNLLHIIQLDDQNITLHKAHTSLKEMITLVITLSRETLKTRPVHVTIPDNLPTINIDPDLLREAFINLLENAVKFSPPHSQIDISVHIEEPHAIVNIQEFGQGITPGEIKKLFKKFYRSTQTDTEQGLGLGLAICHKIITAHGGRVWVESIDKKGTVFHVTLPL